MSTTTYTHDGLERVLRGASLISDAIHHRGRAGATEAAAPAAGRGWFASLRDAFIRMQQARADAAMMRLARLDPRIMAEIQAARARADWADTGSDQR